MIDDLDIMEIIFDKWVNQDSWKILSHKEYFNWAMANVTYALENTTLRSDLTEQQYKEFISTLVISGMIHCYNHHVRGKSYAGWIMYKEVLEKINGT